MLIFEKIYPFIVITDITNFFDSILYSRLEESLYGLRVSPRLISLLFFLLESFSLREALVPVQRIGLPVDPCDCSRVLAHMLLISHDWRIADIVGQDAYVRWMDDQNGGVQSRAEGLRVLSSVCDSLRKLHLTPNSAKSKVLSLVEARRHFHFVTNAAIDKLEKMPADSVKDRAQLRKTLAAAWKKAKKSEGQGEWVKILKRLYRQAARSRSKMFVQRAVNDVKQMPALVDRVADYMRYVASSAECITFVEVLLEDEEQVYPDVNYQLIESLLKLAPDAEQSARLLVLAKRILDGSWQFPGAAEARSLSPLLVLRYGNGNDLKTLFTLLKSKGDSLPQGVTRSLCAVVGGCKAKGFQAVEVAASKLLRNHLSEFVRLINRIRGFTEVPGRFKFRVSLKKDSISGTRFVDMRAILSARILGLSNHKSIRLWLVETKAGQLDSGLTKFEQSLLARLWPKPDHSN